MAITFVAASAVVSDGLATGSAAATVTPALPTGTASGDRVFVGTVGTTAAGTTPTGWTLVGTATLGTGTVAASAGTRVVTVYFRDYDGAWTMPAFTQASGATPTLVGAAVTYRKAVGEAWGTPTFTTGSDTATAATGYSATGAANLSATAGDLLLAFQGNPSNVTTTVGAITATGLTVGTVNERVDGGSATGFDASIHVFEALPTAGTSTAAPVQTSTVSTTGQSSGGTMFVRQTAAVSNPKIGTLTDAFTGTTLDTGIWTADDQSGTGADITVSGGALHMLAQGYYPSITSVGHYDLTGSALYMDFPIRPPYPAYGSTEESLELFLDSNNVLSLITTAGDNAWTWARVRAAGVQTDNGGANVPASARYFRIWESGGNVTFDYSNDNTTWSQIHSMATPFAVTNLQARVKIGHWDTAEPTFDAVVQGVNVIAPVGTDYTKFPADTADATDAVAVIQGENTFPGDTAGAVDAVAVTQGENLFPGDTAGAVDAASAVRSAIASAADVAAAADAVAVVQGENMFPGDSAGAVDAVSVVRTVAVTVADVAAAVDSATGSQSLSAIAGDVAAAVDAVTTARSMTVTVADVAGAVDSVSTVFALTRTVADVAAASDTSAVAQGFNRAPADVAGAVDAATTGPTGLTGLWTPIFSDEFTGTTLDSAKWQPSRYGSADPENSFTTGEGAFFQSKNVSVSGGNLVIVIQPEALTLGGRDYTHSTGTISSENLFYLQPGDFIEARINVPTGDGLWPGFWLVPSGQWPPEIDIFEFFDTSVQSRPRFNFHRVTGPPAGPMAYGDPTVDHRDSWHVYGVKRDMDGVLTPYVDGVPYPGASVMGADTSLGMFVIFNQGMYTGRNPTPGTLFKVDWVRAWRPASTAVTRAKLSTLTDTFDTALDTSRWGAISDATAIPATVSGGALRLSNGATGEYPDLRSGPFDFAGSSFAVEMVSAPPALASTETLMSVRWDKANLASWMVLGTGLQARVTNAGTNTNGTYSVTYNPAVHKRFRIRESGGSVFFDTFDGTTWTNRDALAISWPSMTVQATLTAGHWADETPGTAVFDNVNIDAGANAYTQSPADAAAGADAASRVLDAVRPVADVAGAADAVATTASSAVTAADAAGGVDAAAVVVSAARLAADTAGAVDSASAQLTLGGVPYTQTPADAAGAVDAASAVQGMLETAADVAAGVDAVSAVQGLAQSYADAAAGLDAVGAVQGVARTVADVAGAVDAVSVTAAAFVTVTDSAAATDSVADSQSTVAADAAGATDAVAFVQAAQVTVADTAGAVDAVSVNASGSLSATATDTASAVDAVSTTMASARTVADVAGAVDAVVTAVGVQGAAADVAGAVDAVTVSLTGGLFPADTAAAVDAVSWTASASVTVADGAAAVDTTIPVQSLARGAADAAGAIDAASAGLTLLLQGTAADAAGATDAVTASAARQSTAVDTAGATDVVTYTMVRVVFVDDTAGVVDTVAPQRNSSWLVADSAAAVDEAQGVLANAGLMTVSWRLRYGEVSGGLRQGSFTGRLLD